MDLITLTTDFGTSSGYPAAMKGVILSINHQATVIDISHSILPQNINQGAFVLYSVVDYFLDAIHVGVIDPGVGTSRAGLVFKCRNGVLIGPDNGLLVPAAQRLGIDLVVKLSNQLYWRKEVSSTFHGRDIFAPVAAHFSKGVSVDELGEEVTEYVKLDLFDVQEEQDSLTGQVLNIDGFGNIITNFSKEIIDKYFNAGDILKLGIGEWEAQKKLKLPFTTSYEDMVQGELLALISSSGFLELAANQGNATKKLKLKISDKIKIYKKN